MITIDGQEGGGQILRSALSLSMITGTPFVMRHIRGRRPKPGLMRQHLTCVKASAKISDAWTDGVEIGSTSIGFHPREIKSGDYDFAIGTAGSTMLLLQTLLPALWSADGSSSVRLSGGHIIRWHRLGISLSVFSFQQFGKWVCQLRGRFANMVLCP